MNLFRIFFVIVLFLGIFKGSPGSSKNLRGVPLSKTSMDQPKYKFSVCKRKFRLGFYELTCARRFPSLTKKILCPSLVKIWNINTLESFKSLNLDTNCQNLLRRQLSYTNYMRRNAGVWPNN